MRILLDTHVAYWAVGFSERLPVAARNAIAEATSAYVSAVTVWEIAIKNQLERSRQPFDVAADVAARRFGAAGLKWAPLDWRHAAHVEHLPKMHGDPFDRLIAAQAIVEGLRLVTHDAKLAAYDPSFIHV